MIDTMEPKQALPDRIKADVFSEELKQEVRDWSRGDDDGFAIEHDSERPVFKGETRR